MIRIIDPEGQILLENEYGIDSHRLSFNRVVRQCQGNGERYFEYEDIVQEFETEYNDDSRPSHQTTVIERNGDPIHYIFNRFGKILFREENVIRNGIVRHIVSRSRYNRDGRLVAFLSPEGVLTQYLFGREYYVKRHGIEDEEVFNHNDLTVGETGLWTTIGCCPLRQIL